jgi:hypothetical protein
MWLTRNAGDGRCVAAPVVPGRERERQNERAGHQAAYEYSPIHKRPD